MPRQRMATGEHGRITQWSSQGRHFASTYVRDTDGKRRRVERSSSKSAEDARRILQRHLQQRRAPLDSGQIITTGTSLAELFELWMEAQQAEDGISEQSIGQYRQVWRTHGAEQIGALRVAELQTSQASKHLVAMGAVTQPKRLRMILSECSVSQCATTFFRSTRYAKRRQRAPHANQRGPQRRPSSQGSGRR